MHYPLDSYRIVSYIALAMTFTEWFLVKFANPAQLVKLFVPTRVSSFPGTDYDAHIRVSTKAVLRFSKFPIDDQVKLLLGGLKDSDPITREACAEKLFLLKAFPVRPKTFPLVEEAMKKARNDSDSNVKAIATSFFHC